jgi:hypothetical protein
MPTLKNDRNWPEIEAELKTVFTEVERKERGNGIIEIHGYSDLFQPPTELASHQYSAIFTNEEGKIKFLRFEDYYKSIQND